jgi:hypothetical protein
MVSIQVLWKDSGTPAAKQKVACCFGRRWGDNKTSDVTTNEHGIAYFQIEPTNGEVYVNGTTIFKGVINGNIVVYLDNVQAY